MGVIKGDTGLDTGSYMDQEFERCRVSGSRVWSLGHSGFRDLGILEGQG